LKSIDLLGGPSQLNGSNGAAPLLESTPAEEKAAGYSRKNPFSARLLVNRKLTGEGSEKDTLNPAPRTVSIDGARGLIWTENLK
jgi:hypothetical protein